MNNPSRCFAKILSWCLVSTALILSVWTTHADNKLSPAELIAKHLDAIGSAEARAKVHAMQLRGTSMVIAKLGGAGQVDGSVVMVSQGNQNLINMTFDAADYPQELLKYDGKTFTTSQIRPGVRTSLEVFFMTNDILFKEGLIGGTLSSAWPLLDLQQKNPKLEYAGLKKIAGKQLHALKYTPRKGSDLKITLFFDAESFQHVRTEYEETIYATEQRRIGGGGGRLPGATDQRSANAQIHATEEFSDFRPESGLTLPHNYKFELSIQSEVRPALVDWEIKLTEFTFNQTLDAKWFGPGL
jgi:hypothetical protein